MLCHNKNYDIEYFGLMIWDKLHLYARPKVMVDLHKQEKTNGCIFTAYRRFPIRRNSISSSPS